MIAEIRDVSVEKKIKPYWLMRRILWPVFVGLLLLVSISLFIFIRLVLNNAQLEVNYDSASMKTKWETDLFHHEIKLNALGHGLARNAGMRQAIESGDRAQLLQIGLPLYEAYKKQFLIDTMAIVSHDSRVLVRFHLLEAHSGTLNNSTINMAIPSGGVANGIAIGMQDRLLNRSVTPVYEQDRLLGYIIVGETLDKLLQHLDEAFAVKHIALLDKGFLSRHKMTEVIDEEYHPIDMARFPSLVLFSNSMVNIPEPLLHGIESDTLDNPGVGNIIKDGNRLYALGSLPIKLENGEKAGVILTLRDITEQQQNLQNSIVQTSLISLLLMAGLFIFLYRITGQAEKKLISSYEELKQVWSRLDRGVQYWNDSLNAIKDPVFIHDAEFRIVRANQAYAERAGMELEAIIGLRYHHCFPRSDKPMPECVLGLQSDIYDEEEHEITLPDGTVYRSRAYVTRDRNGAYMHAVHIMLDITREREREKLVSDSAARLGSIMRAVPVGVGLLKQRVFQYVNENVCAITGYARDELIGQSSRILYADDDEFERVGREKYAALRDIGVGEIETRLRRKDGEIIDVKISSVAIDSSDLDQGVTFTLTDITYSKAQEKRLRTQLEELQRFEKVSVGREKRIKELRDEMSSLKNRLNEKCNMKLTGDRHES
ncbi:MAG: PAS domain S-box protein [Gammaproteobacteria bacterium]|nr:PAS domain S-box protein [Gammaproteobacteria bacterium]